MENVFIGAGIIFCLSQSAIFSGLNLAFFSLTRLRLEIAAEEGLSPQAVKVLALRKDSNFLLTTVLWGNVGINVLLTLLTESIMTGVFAFAFSTGIITFFGEIIPQAYFSRNALRMASALAPVLKFYQVLLFPIAKPCAILLDKWLGKESINYFTEENIKQFIGKHIENKNGEINHIEGMGAINFLALDDTNITAEGEDINPLSMISLTTNNGEVIFPEHDTANGKEFFRRINQSGEKWIIITDTNQTPMFVLNADGFIRSKIFTDKHEKPEKFCHAPLIIKDRNTNLGSIIKLLRRNMEQHLETPIDLDVVLYWTEDNKRIITGADLLGRLLKGI